MLVENQGSGMFSIGDAVKILSTSQVGTIVGVRDGKYEVQVNGSKILYEGSNLQSKQILFG